VVAAGGGSGMNDSSGRASRTRGGGFEPPPLAAIARLPGYPWFVVALTCVGAFIGQLDASIVQLALPALERQFDAGLSAVSWVAIAYLVAFASILPVFARMSEIYGRKVLYLIGYAGFTAASALCGLAPSLAWLVVFRVLQGVAGALLGANSITILVKAAGGERRARAMGLFAAAQAIGVSVGPAVGGLLLGSFGWQSVFWVTVPFGLAGGVAGWFVLPQTVDFKPDRQFDWQGAVLLTPALTAVTLVLSESHAWGWTSPWMIGATLAAMLLLAAFVWREQRAKAPLLDLLLFRDAVFTCGIVAVVLSYALLYGMFFLMSFGFVRGYLDQPLVAGLRLAIIPVAIGLVAPLSGALFDRVGPRILTVGGMAICLTGLGLLWSCLAAVPAEPTMVMLALAIYGVGLGAFIAPNNNATMNAAPADRTGQAGGLLNLMRVFGTSVGIAVGASMLSWRIDVLAGADDRTTGLSPDALLRAVTEALPALAAFAAVAGAASLVRSRRRVGFRP
jgi:EmrB/QacA subfamily drug resistance transporter